MSYSCCDTLRRDLVAASPTLTGIDYLEVIDGDLPAGDPLRQILEHVRALGEKDLSLALELGAELGVDLPMAQFALSRFGAGLGLGAPL